MLLLPALIWIIWKSALPHFPPTNERTLPKDYFGRCIHFTFSHLPCGHHPPLVWWNKRDTKRAGSLYLLQLKTQALSLLSSNRWHQQQMFFFFMSLFGACSLQTLEKLQWKSLSISPGLLRPDVNHAKLKVTSFLSNPDAQLALQQVIFTPSKM